MAYRDMVIRVFKGLGKQPVIVVIPEILWRLGFMVRNILAPRGALKRNINMVLRMNQDLKFDHAEATRDFGYAPGKFEPRF